MSQIRSSVKATEKKIGLNIKRFLRLLHEPGDVFEIRALECPHFPKRNFSSTWSGYFNYHSSASTVIARIDEKNKPFGIYVTLNPVKPELLARAENRILPKAKVTTSDEDVTSLRWIMVDIDPVRPSGVSSTDEEMNAGLELATSISDDLTEQGWPEPLLCMSGNGAYLLYRIRLPSDRASTDLVRRVLQGFHNRYSNDEAVVDLSTFNAARIARVMGTIARKGEDFEGGDGLPARPHRRSGFVMPESELLSVPIDLLEELAAGMGDSK